MKSSIVARLLLAAGLGLVAGFAFAQTGSAKVKRVGYLSSTGIPPQSSPQMTAFREGLSEEGFVEPRNLEFIWRAAHGKVGHLAALARELVHAGPDALLIETTPGVKAALAETKTIPIVFLYVSDPLGSGFAESLRRPGRNATGVTNVLPELSGKLLELLLEVQPATQRIGVLWNPRNPAKKLEYDALARAAGKLVQLLSFPIGSALDIEKAFFTMTSTSADAVVVLAEALTHTHRDQIATLAIARRLPSIFNFAPHAEAGGLIAYSSSQIAMHRRAGTLLGKVLAGANAADLPIEQPTKFELVVNLRTAKALEVAIPRSILLRADRVIE